MIAAIACIVAADTTAKIDADVQAALTRAHVPGATVVVERSGNIVYQHAFGNRSVNPAQPAELETQYEVGSITKQFTAAAILQLKEAGKLRLDDLVSNYVPDAPHSREVTIRQLLAQTSGLPDYMQGVDDTMVASTTSFAQLMSRIADEPLAFSPGTQWEYSNTNYLILGRVVEAVSGESWEAYVKKNLFDRAGLSNTSTIADEARLPQMAQGYTFKGTLQPAPRISEAWGTSTGAIVSTAGDLVKWGDALADGRVVSRQDYNELITDQHLADGTPIGYAFGFFVTPFEGQRRVWHDGNTYGFDASAQFFPQQNLRIVVLTNSLDGGSDGIAETVFNDLYPEIAKNGDASPVVSYATPEAIHRLYVSAITSMSTLRQPQYVKFRMAGTSDGLPMGLQVQGGNLWLTIGGGAQSTSWTVEHRTFDYRSIVTDDANGKQYTTQRSFFDPTWYGTERALRKGMLYSQDPAPPKAGEPTPAPPSGGTLKTIAVTSVMSPALYNISDKGPAQCGNGDPGRALHLWARDHNHLHQLSDVVIDTRSLRFCMIRYSLGEFFGFHGVVEQHFANVGGYWMQTDGIVDGTIRFAGISTRHGKWRYRVADMQFPAALDLPEISNH